MVRFGCRTLALLVLLAGAGCTSVRATDDHASVSASAHPTTATTGTTATTPTTEHSTPTPTKSTGDAAPPGSRMSATPRIPAVSEKARAAGLMDIRTIVPDAIIDLRYATRDNFLGAAVYPPDARCLVHESMADGLVAAARRLRAAGYQLVFWDCYRPHWVQVRMFQIVPNPDWVARPGPYATSHEAGRSVDVTLAYAANRPSCPATQRVQGHCLLDMGTGFDDFTSRAYAFATAGVTSQAQHNRAVLRNAMNAGGLATYWGEWWHFDGPGAGVQRPILGAPLD